MATQNYLVVGATGKQGGAVLSALLSASPAFPIHIYALTRNSDSPRAKSLAAHPNVTVVVGDPASPSSIFSQLDRPLAGVFCVTIPGKVSEESQAEALIDACVKHRVAHFVFTSGDRGGPDVSETTPTSVPNLQSKYRIEKYLKTQAEGRMSWTILRPTTFFDMLSADFPGKGFASMWKQLGPKPLQLVSTRDIGRFGAKALLEAEKYSGKAVGLSGDELTFDKGCKVFRDVFGKEMPCAPCIVGKGVKWAVPELGAMFGWLETDGYGIDIQGLREQDPKLQNFEQWLKQSSGFREGSNR